MSETILTSTDGEYRVVASIEHEASDPRWGAEFGLMFARHRTYTLGDEHVGILSDLDTVLQEQGMDAVIEWLHTEQGATVILPLYLHDHSGLSMTAGANLLADGIPHVIVAGGWDTSLVGCIFDTAENRLDWVGDTEAILRAEVEEYDLYLRGEVYTLTVQEKVQEATRYVRTYPDDRIEQGDTVRTYWVPVQDHAVMTTYGDKDHVTIAADMLAEFNPAPLT
jgi:hypothetical protein